MRVTFLVLTLSLPALVQAHHSRSEYNQEARLLDGTLVEIIWENPHPAFIIEVTDGGQAETWTVEGWSALNEFYRAGITKDQFAEGDTIQVFGLPSGSRSGRILATHMRLSDGTEAILKRDADSYFNSSRTLGGQRDFAAYTEAAVVDAAAENLGIFRVWSYPSPNMQTRRHLPFTEATEAARPEFDQLDNYVMRCEQKGMPGVMTTPNPYEFIDTGDTITIQGYEGDIVRTVYLDSSLNPQDQPLTLQGFSVGHWEDKHTLIIKTSRISAQYLGMTGAFLSEDVEVVERYT
jgi:hypothetical protein